MNRLIFLCLFIVAMSPLGREGFGEIVKAEILSGVFVDISEKIRLI